MFEVTMEPVEELSDFIESIITWSKMALKPLFVCVFTWANKMRTLFQMRIEEHCWGEGESDNISVRMREQKMCEKGSLVAV